MKQILLMIAGIALVGCGESAKEKAAKAKAAEAEAKAKAAAAEAKAAADWKVIEAAIRETFKTLYPTASFPRQPTKADLEKVTMLDLGFNRLTSIPNGLEKLTQLTHLYLENNPDLTKAQIDELQKALPNCKIISNPKK